MNSGFRRPDGNWFTVVHRRSLGLPYVQEGLRDVDLVTCGCGLPLLPFLDHRFIQETRNVRRPPGSGPHKKGCFADELGDFPAPPLVYRVGAFATPVTRGSTTAHANARSGPRQGSCTHLVHEWFARASMQALCAANPGRAYSDRNLRPFTAKELEASIRNVVNGTQLQPGEPLPVSLQAHGLELVWGLTNAELGTKLHDSVARGRDCEVMLHSLQSPLGKMAPMRLRVPHIVALHAGGRRQAMGSLIAPPYWIFAVIERNPVGGARVAARLVVFPVAAIDAPYAIESEFEREVVLAFHRRDHPILKPGIHYALGELGPGLWPFGLLPIGRLPHRPDLIAFTKGKCWMIEIAGLENVPGYLDLVDQRLAAMVATAQHAAVRGFRIGPKEFAAWMAKSPIGRPT